MASASQLTPIESPDRPPERLAEKLRILILDWGFLVVRSSDYFVGSRQNIRWHCQSDLLGCPEIDYQALITGGAADVFVAHLTSAVSRDDLPK